jgi:hypothetical protein
MEARAVSGEWATVVAGIGGGLLGGGVTVLTGTLTWKRANEDAEKSRKRAIIDARRDHITALKTELLNAWIEGRIKFGQYHAGGEPDTAQTRFADAIAPNVTTIARAGEQLAVALGTPEARTANDAMFLELASWYIDAPPDPRTVEYWDIRNSHRAKMTPTVGDLIRKLIIQADVDD